jgi:signal transduction histidine kinase
MRHVFRGKLGALVVFFLVAGLVAGGLGWATASALRLEREQIQDRADAEYTQRLHVALWRLDGRVAPALTLEDNRAYNHYSAVFVPSVALRFDGTAWEHGQVIEPSPLLHADLPDWMTVHFQVDEESGWQSPQVPHGSLRRRLVNPCANIPQCNLDTDERRRLLDELEKAVPARALLASVQERRPQATVHDVTLVPVVSPWDNNGTFNNNDAQQGQSSAKPSEQNVGNYGRGNPTGNNSEAAKRFDVGSKVKSEVQAASPKDDRNVALNTLSNSGANWFRQNPQKPTASETVKVHVSALMPFWLAAEREEPRLLLVRLVRLGEEESGPGVCQGIALDWPKLRGLLREQVADIFPEADLQPVLPDTPADPERTMSALPVQLVPAAEPGPADPGWTPLRIGLALAWTAALVAIVAVGLVGWSLLALSERRIRFVSAVTHELRTPLTTLRLYLDMLTGGMVKDERQKDEYLVTLNAETDRLNRLVGNVLDFSRLENQTPRLNRSTVTVAVLLEGVREAWQGRCQGAGKELVVETTAPAESLVETDVALAQQVLGNLLDNACKYSKGAADPRVWLRAVSENGRLVLEVEDRGPGVAAGERRSIFRPFRRGQGADVTAGGVGLGLALAERWARLLGGCLTLRAGPEGGGACFRLELPG